MNWLTATRELPGKKEHYATAALALLAAVVAFLLMVKRNNMILISKHDLGVAMMSSALDAYADGLERCGERVR